MDAQTAAISARPLTHKETRLIVWGVLLPLFMGSIDNTILASALPTIGRDLGDVQGLPWLITIYLLAATAAMPLYGKIADIRGRRFTLYIAIAIYLAGSLVCALAPSILVLILGRALQGLGGAGLTSVAIIVLGDAAAPKDRGPYYAWFSVVYTTAGAIGPALGGSIADHLHWSVIFWLNIPLGLMAVWITSTVLRRLPRHERPHRLDLIGAILIVVASVAFMLGLNLGGRSYAWQSLPVILLFTVALVVGAGFVWRLLTAPEPLIPISILLDRIVCCAVLANSLGWAAIVGLNIFLPMYLQSVIGLSPTNAGLSLMVLMMSLNTSAGLAGQLLGRVQRYKILPMCTLVIAIAAMTFLALWTDGMTIVTFEVLLLLIGVGFGPVPSLCAVAMQNRVAQHQLGIAVGTMSFSRNLFTTMLVALLGTIVLSATSAIEPGTAGRFGGAPPPGAVEAAQAFSRAFYVAAACLAAAFVALVLLEEQPLRTGIVKETKA
jgi:EmrB/QacA subfamily drug resistance transporter